MASDSLVCHSESDAGFLEAYVKVCTMSMEQRKVGGRQRATSSPRVVRVTQPKRKIAIVLDSNRFLQIQDAHSCVFYKPHEL